MLFNKKSEQGFLDVIFAILIFFLFLFGTMFLVSKGIDFLAWAMEG